MNQPAETAENQNAVPTESEYELNLTRLVDQCPDKLYRCWTEPELVVQWFTPAPWKTVACENDLRVGGATRITMKSPEGQQFPNEGVFLALEPGRRIVVTDAFVAGWKPSAKPFMVSEITFTPEGDKTRYTARARHWTKEDCDSHREMGFHSGWNKALDQLLEVAAKL